MSCHDRCPTGTDFVRSIPRSTDPEERDGNDEDESSGGGGADEGSGTTIAYRVTGNEGTIVEVIERVYRAELDVTVAEGGPAIIEGFHTPSFP